MNGIDAAGGKTAELLATLKQLIAGTGGISSINGAIIKGKVLRVLSEGQYSLQFGRREVIVDSNLSLRVNDVVHARIGVNGQLNLEKAGYEARSLKTGGELPVPGSSISTSPQQAEAWLTQRLSAPELALIQQEIAASGEADALNQIALMLKNSGLEISAPLLKALRAVLQTPVNQGIFDTRFATPVVARILVTEEGAAVAGKLGEQLATAMRGQMDHIPHGILGFVTPAGEDTTQISHGDAGMSNDDREREQARWALNVQQEGSVNHRVGCIPLMVDGQLVELSVALFDERGRGENPRREFSKVVFDLNLPHLGHVAVNLAGIGTHLDVGMTATDTNASRMLVENSDALRTTLQGLGWQVDRLRYFTELGEGRAPVRAVLQHQVAGDSLARWV